MSKKINIIGCGGHGVICGEIAEAMGYQEINFLDFEPYYQPAKAFDWPVIGKYSVVTFERDVIRYIPDIQSDFIVALGDNDQRLDLSTRLMKMGRTLKTLIHPSAIISRRARVGNGSCICAQTVILAHAVIGFACIINTAATVDHHCQIADGCHLSPGSHLSGSVILGELVWMGTGSCVRDKIAISSGVTVGSGAVVVKNISQVGVYVGIPARLRGDQITNGRPADSV